MVEVNLDFPHNEFNGGQGSSGQHGGVVVGLVFVFAVVGDGVIAPTASRG